MSISSEAPLDFIGNPNSFDIRSKKTILIHPGFRYGFIELDNKFFEKLINELKSKIFIAYAGIDKLSAIDKFAILMLENAY